MRDCCGCHSCAQKAFFKFEPGLGTKIGFEANDTTFGNNTPSTFNGLELMGEQYVRDDRLVLDLCGNSHCDPGGVVGRPFVNPIGQMTDVGKRRPMRMLRDCIQWKMSSSHIWTLRETLLRVMRNCGIAAV